MSSRLIQVAFKDKILLSFMRGTASHCEHCIPVGFLTHLFSEVLSGGAHLSAIVTHVAMKLEVQLSLPNSGFLWTYTQEYDCWIISSYFIIYLFITIDFVR